MLLVSVNGIQINAQNIRQNNRPVIAISLDERNFSQRLN